MNQKKKKPDCKEYIKCEMIINILSSNNIDEQMTVFNCLRKHWFDAFARSVILQHNNIKTEYLWLLAKDEFDEALHAFFINLKNNSYNKTADCITYLKGIFKNNYFKAFRRKKRKLEIETIQSTMNIEISENDLEIKKLNSEKIQTVLNQMSVSCKNHISWFYFDNLSIRQISVINGNTEEAIKNQLFRCRQSFKKCWNETFGSTNDEE